MCKTCGCDESHTHSHLHKDDHNTKRSIQKISLRDNILSENDHIAAHNRQFFSDKNIIAVNMMSSPGAGKTSLLTKTLNELKKKDIKLASFVGDQTTELDADRLKTSETWVHQINTYSSCHLNAKHIEQALPLLPEIPKILFIENVGNLVCPAAFDLGEQIKIAVISCPEGEDKVLKYPVLFHLAHVVILTKIDLIPHLEWNNKLFKQNLKKINPVSRLFELSSKTGEGLDSWIEFLKTLLE